MPGPSEDLIAAAGRAGLVPINTTEHPAVAPQAYRAGLGRRVWRAIDGPTTGAGTERWFQDDAGDLAYSVEHGGRTRLIIFDAAGTPVADIRHVIRRAA